MPSMMRQLIFHEYGHLVDYWICYKKGLLYGDPTEFDKEYAKMRGIDANASYGCGKWHLNIGEIITNDGKIALFNAEPEFFPHPQVKHPNDCPEVGNFWYEMMLNYASND